MRPVRSTPVSYFSGLAFVGLAILLSSAKPLPTAATKTEGAQGVFIGPATDCDGDGFDNDSKIDFDGDGIADECVLDAREDIPEPPFQQSFTPSSEQFNSLIPDVGWNEQYQCGEGVQVTLSRPNEGEIKYSAEGINLSSPVVYDDLDPNLNQPLIVQEPTRGLRYSFQQERNGEFYEYAIADYSGNVGLYVYQTGEQVIATPCQVSSTNASRR
ncbi:MAG: hypothetical protein AB8B99_04430 [Phormidesmis sp.]